MKTTRSAHESVLEQLRGIDALLTSLLASWTGSGPVDEEQARELHRRVNDVRFFWALIGKPRWDYPGELGAALHVTEIVEAPDDGGARAAALWRVVDEQVRAAQAALPPGPPQLKGMLRYQRGSAQAPDDPIGAERLVLHNEGRFSYRIEHAARTPRELTGTLAPGLIPDLARALGRTPFPPPRSLPPPRPGPTRLLTHGPDRLLIGFHDVEQVAAFRPLFELLDAMMDALRLDAPSPHITSRRPRPAAS